MLFGEDPFGKRFGVVAGQDRYFGLSQSTAPPSSSSVTIWTEQPAIRSPASIASAMRVEALMFGSGERGGSDDPPAPARDEIVG